MATNRPTENEELAAVVELLKAHNVEGVHHSPNESDLLGLLRSAAGDGAAYGHLGKLRDRGVSKGFPDIVIFSPPPNMPRKCGLAIELKRTPKPGREGKNPTDEQIEWLENLARWGWLAAVARGQDEAISLLEEAGYLEQ